MPSLEEFGLNSDYIAMFIVLGENPFSAEYIIKDDETLIMYYKDTYIEMKRIEYKENYEVYLHAL